MICVSSTAGGLGGVAGATGGRDAHPTRSGIAAIQVVRIARRGLFMTD